MSASVALFAYGSLRDPAVQRWLFGRLLPRDPDQLEGAVCDWIDDIDPDLVRLTGQRGYPALRRVADRTSAVEGDCLWLDGPALARADRYEGDGYHRTRVALASGRMAWVYLAEPA